MTSTTHPESAPAGRHHPLPNLTALRFFAALLVFGYHITDNGRQVAQGALGGALLTQGFTGVPLFFVLSGFVLAYNYPAVENRRRFYLARMARIYPLFLFALLLETPSAIHYSLYRMHDPFRLWDLPASLVMMQAWLPQRIAFAANPPAWTLSVEAFFYLLFPLVIPFAVRAARKPLLWIGTLWLLSLVPGLVIDLRVTAPAWTPSPIWFRWYYDHSLLPPLFLCEFLMGAVAGASFRFRPRQINGWVAAAAGAVAFASVLLSVRFPYVLVRNGGIALPFVVLLYALSGARSRLLGSRALQLGGEVSYSMYLLQNLVTDLMAYVPVIGHQWWAVLPVLCGVAFVSYTLVEKPARRWVLARCGVPAAPKPVPTPEPMP